MVSPQYDKTGIPVSTYASMLLLEFVVGGSQGIFAGRHRRRCTGLCCGREVWLSSQVLRCSFYMWLHVWCSDLYACGMSNVFIRLLYRGVVGRRPELGGEIDTGCGSGLGVASRLESGAIAVAGGWTLR